LVDSRFDGDAEKLAIDASKPAIDIYDMLSAKNEKMSLSKHKMYRSRLINLLYSTKEIYYSKKVCLSTHIGAICAGFMRI